MLVDGEDCSSEVPLCEVGDLEQHVLDGPHSTFRGRVTSGPIIRTVVVYDMISIEKLYEVVAESRPMVGDNNPGAVVARHVAFKHLCGRLCSLVRRHSCPAPASPLALED